MTKLRLFLSRVSGLWTRRRMEARMEEELQCHMEMLEEEARRRGESAEAARYAAMREFGGVEQTKELCRETRGFPALEALLLDIRHAFRGMLRAPGFTMLVMAVLAVGIGASITVFSILNTLFYRPMAYPHPEQLVMMGEAYTRGQKSGPMAPVRYRDYEEWQRQAQSFERIVAYQSQGFIVNPGGEPERVRGERVADGFFEMLGVRPMLGRGFLAGEHSPGAQAVVVLSEEYWRGALGGRADVIGQTLRLDGSAATIVGVMPGRMRATLIEGGARMWTPLIPSAAEVAYDKGSVSVLARLKPGVALANARSEMAVISRRLAGEHPDPDRDFTIRVDGLQETLAEASSAPVAKVLIMAVVCLLLISCVNVSSLLLGRATERSKEVALRIAMGAGRWRLVRQFLAESLAFALAGGAAGVAWAYLAVGWCSAKMGPLLANDGVDKFEIDGRVLGFALVVSVATAVVFGVLPSLRGSRVDVSGTLKEGGRGHSGGSRQHRLTGMLVMVEVALSVVLVASGGLLLYSIRQYWRFDWGVPLDHRLTMQATPIERKYDSEEKRRVFYRQLLALARQLPGVETAALVNSMPMHRGAYSLQVKGAAAEPAHAGYRVVSPGYYASAGLGLRGGRSFEESDAEDRQPVAVVSESLAAKLWPGAEPIGARVQVDGVWRTVVGISADVPQGLMRATKYEIAVPYSQVGSRSMRVLMRVTGDPGQAVTALRQAVRTLDADLPLGEVQTLYAAKEQFGAPFEFIMALLSTFAVTALLLAGAGIYGVTSRAVAMRTREIGIRMALGAEPRQVLRHVLRGGLRLTLVGTGVGSVMALMVVKVIVSKIWWIEAVPAVVWVGPVALVMAGVAVAATLAPARRATHIAPVWALRAE